MWGVTTPPKDYFVFLCFLENCPMYLCVWGALTNKNTLKWLSSPVKLPTNNEQLRWWFVTNFNFPPWLLSKSINTITKTTTSLDFSCKHYGGYLQTSVTFTNLCEEIKDAWLWCKPLSFCIFNCCNPLTLLWVRMYPTPLPWRICDTRCVFK